MVCGVTFAQTSNVENSDSLQLTPVSPSYENMQADRFTSNRQLDPKSLFPKPEADQRTAFNQMTQNAMPMTPEQILRLRQMLAETKQAAAMPALTPPQPTLSTKIVHLEPGAVPPVIRLQEGFVTTVMFVDITGSNWPIESYDIGDPKSFNFKVGGSNILMMQALKMYAYTNLAIKLKGLATPVVLTLVPAERKVDYRINFQIQRSGPHAQISVKTSQSSPASMINNDALLSFLNNVPPEGANPLKVVGIEDCQAWTLNNKMYIRTSLTLLSPGWMTVMTSSDGTNAYELKPASTLLFSKYGQPVQVKIEGL